MDEARAVLARLDRIEELDREGAPPRRPARGAARSRPGGRGLGETGRRRTCTHRRRTMRHGPRATRRVKSRRGYRALGRGREGSRRARSDGRNMVLTRHCRRELARRSEPNRARSGRTTDAATRARRLRGDLLRRRVLRARRTSFGFISKASLISKASSVQRDLSIKAENWRHGELSAVAGE